ncbi:unnamed protein product [Brassicogethes aeneus]|uniref:Putative hydroxypyruvate isomerase n=1 Tax=Brassicogethes aeneus TaxID=1431903 RepID=A0A9P0BG99_BRAAE|nr:unnamed protein product [Brassicogethes aeneus]
MSKFCANLAFMYTERPFLERYKLAKESGFKAVESGFPSGFTQQQVVDAKNAAGIDQILINLFTGDVTKGELGVTAIPGKENEFKERFQTTLSYAKALGAKKIHIMAGKVEGPVTEDNDRTYENNLKFAAGLLELQDIIGVIEPINKYSVPNYYLNCYDKALSMVNKVNSPNIKIMLDVFHLQHIRGDITNTVKDLKEFIGHVQIAQCPNRNEPNTPGEINYRYILEMLRENGYNDWIGLEYKPKTSVNEGLKWVNEFGYRLY